MRELAVREIWGSDSFRFSTQQSPSSHSICIVFTYGRLTLFSFLQVFELCSIELFLSVCIKLHLEKHRISESPSFRSWCYDFYSSSIELVRAARQQVVKEIRFSVVDYFREKFCEIDTIFAVVQGDYCEKYNELCDTTNLQFLQSIFSKHRINSNSTKVWRH